VEVFFSEDPASDPGCFADLQTIYTNGPQPARRMAGRSVGGELSRRSGSLIAISFPRYAIRSFFAFSIDLAGPWEGLP
jgi:hypothetical protein